MQGGVSDSEVPPATPSQGRFVRLEHSEALWFGLQVRTRSETRLATRLASDPQIVDVCEMPGQGLIFVGVAAALEVTARHALWERVRQHPGVYGVLGSPSPTPVPVHEVLDMARQVHPGTVKSTQRALDDGPVPFVVGDRVRIIGGSFAGFVGVVQRMESGRLHVEVEVFRRPTTVAVVVAHVSPMT